MKSRRNLEDHDVLISFVCLAKMSQRCLNLTLIDFVNCLARDATAIDNSMDFRGSTSQILMSKGDLSARAGSFTCLGWTLSGAVHFYAPLKSSPSLV